MEPIVGVNGSGRERQSSSLSKKAWLSDSPAAVQCATRSTASMRNCLRSTCFSTSRDAESVRHCCESSQAVSITMASRRWLRGFLRTTHPPAFTKDRARSVLLQRRLKLEACSFRLSPMAGRVSARLCRQNRALCLYAVREFLDHRVGEHLAGDALHLGARRLRAQPFGQRKREIFALAHSGYLRKSDLAQGVLDGLALRIQDRGLQRDIDMRLHHSRL